MFNNNFGTHLSYCALLLSEIQIKIYIQVVLVQDHANHWITVLWDFAQQGHGSKKHTFLFTWYHAE